MRAFRIPAIALFAWGAAAAAAGDDEAFEVREIEAAGRTVAAELADLDGDGRTDLLHVDFDGMPPAETRVVRAHLQREDGTLPADPSREQTLPEGSAAYDVADLDERPGSELLLLRRGGVAALSLTDGTLRELDLEGETTSGVWQDEQGLDRLPMLLDAPRGERWLVVPLLGRTAILRPDGRRLGVLRGGARANYFVPQGDGPPIGETGLQLYLDAGRVQLGDVDGDGRTDVLASSRHALRLFLQRSDGTFASEPDRTVPYGRISELDHVRGAGTVSVECADLDADGRVDLVVTHTSGGLTRTRAETTIHLNRNGHWDLQRADQRFESSGGWSAHQLLDLDGDRRPELVRIHVPLSVLELVEFFLTRSFDAELEIHRPGRERPFEEGSGLRLKLDVPWSLESFRPRGFIATLEADLNADGYRDLLRSHSGKAIEVHLGGSARELRHRVLRQAADTRGRVRFGDLDGDGLTDLLMYDPTRPQASIRIARNAGRLPGTRPGNSASRNRP